MTVLGHERGVHRIDLLNAPGGLVEPPPRRPTGTERRAAAQSGRVVRPRTARRGPEQPGEHRRGDEGERHAPRRAAPDGTAA